MFCRSCPPASKLQLSTKKGNVYNIQGHVTLICDEIKIVLQELLQFIVEEKPEVSAIAT